jgi:hypothetical protein
MLNKKVPAKCASSIFYRKKTQNSAKFLFDYEVLMTHRLKSLSFGDMHGFPGIFCNIIILGGHIE